MLIVGEVGDRGNLILADSERMSLLTIVDEDGTDFAAFYNPADAIRLAACWNACNGISTEHLENLAGGPEHGVSAYAMGNVMHQRDELLAALTAITDHFANVMGGPMISGQGVTFANGVDGIPTIKRARELIAKAKSE